MLPVILGISVNSVLIHCYDPMAILVNDHHKPVNLDRRHSHRVEKLAKLDLKPFEEILATLVQFFRIDNYPAIEVNYDWISLLRNYDCDRQENPVIEAEGNYD